MLLGLCALSTMMLDLIEVKNVRARADEGLVEGRRGIARMIAKSGLLTGMDQTNGEKEREQQQQEEEEEAEAELSSMRSMTFTRSKFGYPSTSLEAQGWQVGRWDSS